MNTVTLKREPSHLSSKDEAAVLEVMRAMLASSHFAKSKRYPALFKYCVESTLNGDLYALKERVIGSDLFGRPADYDSSDDPVVRIAAGEVRKRIALYFDEHHDSPVRIDLPLGSYFCTFHFSQDACTSDSDEASNGSAEISQNEMPSNLDLLANGHFFTSRSPRLGAYRVGLFICIAVVIAVGLLGTWHAVQLQRKRDLWYPVLHNTRPALIVVGQARGVVDPLAISNSPRTLVAEALQPKNQIELANAMAAADVCGVFQGFNRACTIVPALTVSTGELYHKTIVLVGGFDNPWTERLLAPQRFHFKREITSEFPNGKVLSITDSTTGSSWSVDNSMSLDQMKRDYLVIARFRSDATDDDVVVAAGIWTLGTQVAGEYIASPDKMKRIISLAPSGWKGVNFEAVLEADVINGETGDVRVVAAHYW